MIDQNVLDNCVLYLAGPINFAPDNGRNWRSEFKHKALQKGCKFTILDPTDKPTGLGEHVNEERDYAEVFRENEQWDDLTKYVKRYRRIDLRMVDLSDIFIMYVNVDIHTCGTYQEMTFAESQRKPILAIIHGGKKKAPDWLFAVVNHNEMFATVDECVNYLTSINTNMIGVDERWVFIRKALITKEQTNASSCRI